MDLVARLKQLTGGTELSPGATANLRIAEEFLRETLHCKLPAEEVRAELERQARRMLKVQVTEGWKFRAGVQLSDVTIAEVVVGVALLRADERAPLLPPASTAQTWTVNFPLWVDAFIDIAGEDLASSVEPPLSRDEKRSLVTELVRASYPEDVDPGVRRERYPLREPGAQVKPAQPKPVATAGGDFTPPFSIALTGVTGEQWGKLTSISSTLREVDPIRMLALLLAARKNLSSDQVTAQLENLGVPNARHYGTMLRNGNDRYDDIPFPRSVLHLNREKRAKHVSELYPELSAWDTTACRLITSFDFGRAGHAAVVCDLRGMPLVVKSGFTLREAWGDATAHGLSWMFRDKCEYVFGTPEFHAEPKIMTEATVLTSREEDRSGQLEALKRLLEPVVKLREFIHGFPGIFSSITERRTATGAIRFFSYLWWVAVQRPQFPDAEIDVEPPESYTRTKATARQARR